MKNVVYFCRKIDVLVFFLSINGVPAGMKYYARRGFLILVIYFDQTYYISGINRRIIEI